MTEDYGNLMFTWVVVGLSLCLIVGGVIGYLNGYSYGKQKIMENMKETDGMQIDNWICYNAVDDNRSQSIQHHEMCHYLIKEDNKHFCDGVK